MSDWVIAAPGEFRAAEALGEGECSLSKKGTLTVRTEDLELVGIGEYATVLADASGLKIGIRSVRDGEQSKSMRVGEVSCGKGKVNAARRRINIMPALRILGVTPESVAGRYEFATVADLLVLRVSEPSKDELAAVAAKST